jgi:hypothetical protein
MNNTAGNRGNMRNYGILKKSFVSAALFTVLLTSGIGLQGCAPPNHMPEILSLKASEMVVDYSESCLIECLAYDQDGDGLNYSWTAEDGKITKMDDEGNLIAWTAPKNEGMYSITVEVDDGGEEDAGKASSSIEIQVKNNHAPVITELKADSDWMTLGGENQLSVSAEDEDGDELHYEWIVEAGEISGTGKSVSWKAPDETGLYEIKAVVNDGFGKEDERIISVSVSLMPPPEIIDVEIVPREPKYFREENGSYRILRDEKCTFTCIVDNAHEGLVYEWSDGEDTYTGPGCCGKTAFTGEGATVTWQAPDRATNVVVSVYVYDELGNVTSRNFSFKVESCGCDF